MKKQSTKKKAKYSTKLIKRTGNVVMESSWPFENNKQVVVGRMI
jgi:hypothetical protein